MPHRQITTMRSNQPRRTDRQPAALILLVVGSSRGTFSFQIALRYHKFTQIRVICYKNQLSLAVIFCRYLQRSWNFGRLKILKISMISARKAEFHVTAIFQDSSKLDLRLTQKLLLRGSLFNSCWPLLNFLFLA